MLLPGDVNGALSLLLILHFKRHEITLLQLIAKAGFFDVALVKENVLAVHGNEAKAFG
jgi:hypothetical protein